MDQAELLKYVVDAFEALGIDYMIGGAHAAVFYGEPRLTRDIDVVADVRLEHVPRLLERFPAGEFYLSEEAAQGAILGRGQFNIIHPSSGLKIDVILPKGTEYDAVQFSRRERHAMLEGHDAYFARPEDVILSKMLYFREGGSERHVRDIIGILKVSGSEIGMAYIAEWAARLGLVEIWESVRRRAAEG